MRMIEASFCVIRTVPICLGVLAVKGVEERKGDRTLDKLLSILIKRSL